MRDPNERLSVGNILAHTWFNIEFGENEGDKKGELVSACTGSNGDERAVHKNKRQNERKKVLLKRAQLG